jgi:hypothetical protein
MQTNDIATDERLELLLEAVREHSGLTDEEILEAGQHGADCGWAGFTWTVDCAMFAQRNRLLVWELLSDEAEEMGAINTLAYLASFARAEIVNDADGLETLLAWWALETCGHYLEAKREEANPYPGHPLTHPDAPSDPRERWRIRNGR